MNQAEQNSHEITRMLREWSGGNREAFDELLPLVYSELHRHAARYLRRERPDHTLQPTALINEAYLKLIDQREVNWANRTHFFALGAQAMLRILVDHARTRQREKRGGEDEKLPLDEALTVAVDEKDIDLLALDEVLTRLEKKDQQQTRIVELRYFSGLSLEETAEALNISRTTAARDWAMAKAWLHRELTR
jgi:RNA polymerase sigma factor (TIGR02999 family)